MDISHVEYELAKADNQWGVTSANFVPEGATLLMGNQLLASFDKDYESPSRDGRPSSSPLYTVEEVVKCLTHFERDE